MTLSRDSKLRRAARWADVRGRGLGMWAYALNRLTGIGLVAYLYLHLAVLSQLAKGPSAWDGFVALARTRLFLTLDVVLLAGLLIHGLNGLRVTLNGFGIAVRSQKALFIVLMALAAITLIVGAVMIYGK